MKHTPGPWVVVKGVDADDWGVTELKTPPPSATIARMVWEQDANLIAAAPDLLAACTAAWNSYGRNGDISTDALEKMEAAIGKAEGK